MHELNHLDQQPEPRATVGGPRPGLAPPGFARTALVSVGVIALALGISAAARQQWGHLVAVGGVAPVALLLQWAMTTYAAARRGAPVRPVAAVAALVVIWAGILAGLVVCALALFAPDLLGLTVCGGAR